jgi:hypothetical protein
MNIKLLIAKRDEAEACQLRGDTEDADVLYKQCIDMALPYLEKKLKDPTFVSLLMMEAESNTPMGDTSRMILKYLIAKGLIP